MEIENIGNSSLLSIVLSDFHIVEISPENFRDVLQPIVQETLDLEFEKPSLKEPLEKISHHALNLAVALEISVKSLKQGTQSLFAFQLIESILYPYKAFYISIQRADASEFESIFFKSLKARHPECFSLLQETPPSRSPETKSQNGLLSLFGSLFRFQHINPDAEYVSFVPFTFLVLLNFFGALGGFDLICRRVKENLTPVIALSTMKVLQDCSKMLSPSTVMDLYPQMKSLMEELPPLIARQEDVRSLKTSSSLDITFYFGSMFESYFPLEIKAEKNRFEVSLWLELLVSPNLEKRRFAQSEINNKIEFILSNASSSYSNFLTREMASLLLKNSYFEIIFGESAHHELIKISFPFIKLLLIEDELTTERLEKIFRLVKDKHDVTKNACLSLLSDSIEVLPYPKAAWIIGKTLDDFLERGDEHLLPILKRLFKNPRFNSRNTSGPMPQGHQEKPNEPGEIPLPFAISSKEGRDLLSGLESKEPSQERKKLETIEFMMEETKETEEELLFFKLGEKVLSTLWECLNSPRLGGNKCLSDNILGVIKTALLLRMSILRCEYLSKCLELLKDPMHFSQVSQLILSMPKGTMPFYKSRAMVGAIYSKTEFHSYLLKEMMLEEYIHESLVTLKYEEIDENYSSDGEEGTQDMIEETQISDSGGQEDNAPALIESAFEPSDREDPILTIGDPETTQNASNQNRAEGSNSRRNNSVDLMTLEENIAPNEDDRDSFSTSSSVDRDKVLNAPLAPVSVDPLSPGNDQKKWASGNGPTGGETLNSSPEGAFGDSNNQNNQMSTTFGMAAGGGHQKQFKNNGGGPGQLESRNKPQFIKKIEERLTFLKNTVLAAKERISGGFVGFLWQYLVVNRLSPEELSLYFDFISECLVKTYFPIIEFDIVHSIYTNILLRLDYSTMSMPMYQCLENVILFLNKSFSIIKSDLVEGFQLLKPELFGVEALWEVVFTCSMKKCADAALALLMKVFRKGSLLTEKPLNHLHEAVIPQLFRRMEENYLIARNSRDKEELVAAKLSLIRSVEAAQYLIEEFDQVGDHLQRKIVQEETITLTVDNNIGNSLPPKKFQIQVTKSIKVSELKKCISAKINPPIFAEDIMLFNKGSMLMEDKQLDSYKVQAGQTICVSKNTTYVMEEDFLDSVGTNMVVEKPTMSSAAVKERAEMICSVIPDLSMVFAEWLVLKKEGSDPDEIVISLMDETTLSDYKSQFENYRQLEERKKISANDTLGGQALGASKLGMEEEAPMTLGKFIAKTRTNFELIFAIEGLDIPELNVSLWKLLQSLPICEPILEEVAAVEDASGVNSSKWEEVVIRDNIHQSLYNLTILKGKLICRTLPESKEVQKNVEWRENFLGTGGVHFLVSLLKRSASAPRNTSQTRYVAVVMALIRGILNAYLLAAASSLENCSSIKEAILRVQNRKTSIANVSSSSGGNSERTNPVFMASKTPMSSPSPASSANMTPTFASPNTSRTHSSHSLLGNTKDAEEKKEEVPKVDEFESLVSSISSKHFESLKEVFVLPELVQCVMSHITHCCKSFSESQSESLELFEECIEFLIPCLAADQTLLAPLLDQNQVLTQLCENLLISPQGSIRKTIRHFIGVLSHSFLLKSTLADLLIPLAVHLDKKSAVNNDDFFFALIDFLEGLPQAEIERIIPLSDFVTKLAMSILDRPIFEGRHNEIEDAGLQGLMATLSMLVHTFPVAADCIASLKNENKSFVSEIYDFLFLIKEEKAEEAWCLVDLPKCKRKTTRQRAFELLLQISQNNFDVFLEILAKVDKNHRTLETASLDTLNVELKGSTGFVGLKNFGCTCYINSLMQQLFMIPSFKERLLSIPIIERPGEVLKDNVLYQVQVIFANLSESVKQYFAPSEFCASFKGYDGLPMPLLIQQDVNEFFNMLCDRFEERIKGTVHADLFSETIQGLQCNQIISLEEEFPFVNQHEEPFLTLSLEIKHRRNLFEALDAMLKGEKLEGDNKYYSEKFQRKVDVQKRSILKKLPNTLIITLKRIEFDIVQLVNVKSNEYFEFPESFDIKRWTVYAEEPLAEGTMPDDSYFYYELVGVLVHSGFADYGHYYSFIKDRERQKGKWFDFNDANVRPFNPAFLKRECFGGASGEVEVDDFFGVKAESQKSRNAYLLFYEKTCLNQKSQNRNEHSIPREPSPNSPIGPIGQKPPLSNPAKEEIQHNEQVLKEPPVPASFEQETKLSVSVRLKEMVWKENYEHLRMRLLYDPDYFSFMKKFLSYWMPSGSPPETMKELSQSPIVMGLIDPESSPSAQQLFPLTLTKKTSNKGLWYFSLCPELRNRAPTSKTFGIHMVHLAFHFAYESLIKLKDSSSFQQCILLLNDMCDQYPLGSMYLLNLLSAQPSTLKDLILKPMLNEGRHAFGKLIIKCFGDIFSFEKELLTGQVFDFFTIESMETLEKVLRLDSTVVLCERLENGGGKISVPSSIMLRFLHVYCVSLGFKVQKHFRKAFEYFQVIKHLLHSTPQTLMYLHPQSAFDKLVQLFEIKWTESSIGSFSDPKMDPTLIQLLDIICLWVLGTSRKIWKTTNIIPSPSTIFPSVPLFDLPELSDATVKILSSNKWLTKIFPAIFTMGSRDSAIKIIERLCWADILTSSSCITSIKIQLMNDDLTFTHCPVDALFLIAQAVFSVRDTEEYMQKRVTYFLEPVYTGKISIMSYLFAIRDAKRYFVISCLHGLGDLIVSTDNHYFQNHFYENSEKYEWILDYLYYVQNDAMFIRNHQISTPIFNTIANFKKALGLEGKLLDGFGESLLTSNQYSLGAQPAIIEEVNPCNEEENEEVEFDLGSRINHDGEAFDEEKTL